MPKLSSLLVRDSVVSVDLIEEALQRQVLEGGEIDSALLELDAVGENILSAYRAACFGLPPAARDDLKGVDPEVLGLLPTELVAKLRVLPISADDSAVVVAAFEPPDDAAMRRLSQVLGRPVLVRIATEARVEASLALHYDIAISPRLRFLSEQLETRMPGQLCEVEPLASDSSAKIPAIQISLDDEEGSIPPPPAEQVAVPSASTESAAGEVDLASVKQRLAEARDRDEVLHQFFGLAQRHFDCAVLFSIRDDRALGLEAMGMRNAAHVSLLSIPLARDGTLQEVAVSRLPKLMDLRKRPADRAFLLAIGRSGQQPCALLPITIRRRVVSMLYGDRNGETMKLEELSALIELLPSVTQAFERIIRDQKRAAMDARRRAMRGRRTPAGAFGRHAAHASVAGGNANDAGRSSGTSEPAKRIKSSPSLRVEGVTGAKPSDIEARPTVRLPRSEPPPPAQSAAPPKAIPSKPAPGSGEYSLGGSECAQPSATSPPQDRADPRRTQNRRRSSAPPQRRRASRPPAAGSHGGQDASSNPVSLPEPESDAAATRAARRSSPAAATTPLRPRHQASDPRREREDSNARVEEVVSISAAIQQSLRVPSDTDEAREEEAASADSDSSQEAERVVDELCRCGPDDEEPFVAALLRLGEPGLEALFKRFPGPLWFDYRMPHAKRPAGRDVCAIARALYAFDDKAVPYIALLLDSHDADSRLYASLLAADRVQPDLLWPVYERLFDEDPEVRRLTMESLTYYRNVPGFDDLLRSLRHRAVGVNVPLEERQTAIEMLRVLRDADGVGSLIEALQDADPTLTSSARKALTAITGQDYGHTLHRWQQWYEQHGTRHRAEWLIEGLMHEDEAVRAVASSELQRLSQLYNGYVASAPSAEREAKQQSYRDWWRHEGKKQFGR